MFGFKKIAMPDGGEGAARAATRRSAPRTSISSITIRSRGPTRRAREGDVRPRLLLGRRERKFWELGDGVYVTAVGYAGGLDAQSDLRGSLLRPHRPQRGGAGGLRPEEDFLRDAAQDVLGKPRPDPGHAPGQRCRHAISLRHLHLHAGAAARPPRRRRRCTRRRSKARRYGAITTEIVDAPPFYFAEDYHQQYLAKNPFGYCGLGGTGVSCPIGTGAKLAQAAGA